MPRTVDIAAASLSLHQQEITRLLAQNPVDHLAVEELLVKCQRLNGQLISARNLTDAANAAARRKPRPDVAAVLDLHIPTRPMGAFVPRYLKGAM